MPTVSLRTAPPGLQEKFPQGPTPTWSEELRQAFTTLEDLAEAGILTVSQAQALAPRARQFRFRLPRYYAGLFDKKLGTRCPIFRQSVPATGELDPTLPLWAKEQSLKVWGRETPWLNDAIGDCKHLVAPRLTHRYQTRALLHVTDICGLYCRFCFRKGHLAEREADLYRGSFGPAIEYLAAHPEVHEVILTGGDPLSMTDTFLTRLLGKLAELPHLRVIRIHSRMPVTLPARLTRGLGCALSPKRSGHPLQVVLVAHFNHPTELTRIARDGIAEMQAHGVVVYNQNVLMRGVNDQLAVLASLYQTLYTWGVTPLYLHHPDLTPGTFHFRVGIARGKRIVRKLRGLVSGPALPEYVLDMPGGLGKISLLDGRAQKLAHFSSPGLRGTLWAFRTSHTKAGRNALEHYLDLRPVDLSPKALR